MTDSSSPDRGPSPAKQIVKLGQLSMRSRRDGDTHIVSVSGEMDVDNAGGVEQELIRAEATDALAIVLDLGGLTFIDSTGIRMLLMVDARSRSDGDRVILRHPSQAVRRVLHIAGLEDRLHFADE